MWSGEKEAYLFVGQAVELPVHASIEKASKSFHHSDHSLQTFEITKW